MTVERLRDFRGPVVVQAEEEMEEAGDLVIQPATMRLPAWQQTATFQVTADEDADPGDKVVHVTATTGLGDEVRLDVRVKVVPGQ